MTQLQNRALFPTGFAARPRLMLLPMLRLTVGPVALTPWQRPQGEQASPRQLLLAGIPLGLSLIHISEPTKDKVVGETRRASRQRRQPLLMPQQQWQKPRCRRGLKIAFLLMVKVPRRNPPNSEESTR